MKKPNGMCTIACDVKKKTVTLGFHTSEQAQQHRDDMIEVSIESTMGMRRSGEMIELNFTPEDRESATAQTIIETVERIRAEADQYEQQGLHDLAKRTREHADNIVRAVNDTLAEHRNNPFK